MTDYAGPMWTGPTWVTVRSPMRDAWRRHAERRYDRVLDIIRGDLVVDGKRREGKHRKNLST